VDRKEVIFQERDVVGAAAVMVLLALAARSFLPQQCRRGVGEHSGIRNAPC